MASVGPIWGSLADNGSISTKALLVGNVASWGVFTIMQSMVSSFYRMVVLRALIGTCLSCVYPLTQVSIAAQVDSESRGGTFGWLQFFWFLGQGTSMLVGTSISHEIFSVAGNSIMGWRLAYFTVGAVSLAIAFMILLFLEELPQRSSRANGDNILADVFKRARSYFSIPTFRIIVLQGLFGSVPGQAIGFLAMFFQYIGFSDTTAASMVTSFVFMQAVGGVLGGYLGDMAARCSKRHGRIVVAQVSILSGIPCFALIYYAPPVASSLPFYATACVCYGLFAYWCMGSAKRPMLSEIVRREDWASIFALDTAFESSCAAVLGANFVGLLAQLLFGYTPVHDHVSQIPLPIRKANTRALALGMLWVTLVPQVICSVIWASLHWIYPNDIDAIQSAQDVERECASTPLLRKE